MTLLTITQEDNDRTEAEICKNEVGWDKCACCPVAQALNRAQGPLTWFVSAAAARPKGALAYWFRFSRCLTDAIKDYDKHRISILGTFQLYEQKDNESTKDLLSESFSYYRK